MDQVVTAPVRKDLLVACSQERAFAVFTDGLATWWPLDSGHSIFEDKAATCVMEPLAGGRIYEISDTGEEASWGEVRVWEPPSRVVLAWNPNPNRTAHTEIEVTFTPAGDETRVVLEHRNWELLGEEAMERRSGYETGWDPVLERFAAAAVSAG